MKPIRYVIHGLCCLALVNGPMLDALAAGSRDGPWQIVPDETLRDLRGGLDLGPLIGNFTIQRVVEINGEVVARMQIVISNLDRLGQGGMPTVSISGPLAELVQVFNPTGGSASARLPTNSSSTVRTNPASPIAPASQPTNSAATPATASTVGGSPGSAATVVTNNGPHIGSTSGNSGTTSATGTQTGSLAQFGAAISQAVAVANGSTSANAPAPVAANPSSAPSSSAPALASQISAASQTSSAPAASAAAAASTAAPASASDPAQSFSKTIPVGNTGEVIVVSNIPNAAAITSAVQNSVQATRVQTLTTITATLNSLQLLSAAQIANEVRQQLTVGH